MLSIRLEAPGDIAAIRTVNERAFGQADEAFMILVLDESAMKSVSGVARYRNEFGETS